MKEYVRVNLTIPKYLYEDYERYRDRVNMSSIFRVALQQELGMLEMLDNHHFSNWKLARDEQHSTIR